MKKTTRKILIEKLDDDLHGVAFSGGKKYVVKGALKGELVEVEELRVSGTAVICRLLRVLNPSADRITPPCKLFGKCGGCTLLEMDYDKQLAAKTALVKRKFSVLGFSDISPCVGFNVPNYRNKVHICFGFDKNKITAGFFDEYTHEVLDAPYCPCHGDWYHTLYTTLVGWAAACRVPIYNPKSRKGLLRFAVARCVENRLLLTLVITKLQPLDFKPLYAALTKRFSEVVLFVNENGELTNEVFSGRFTHIAGAKTLNGNLLGIDYSLSPDSFFQVNTAVTEKIYSDVLEKVKASGADKVVDLFSGIGITSALFAKEGVAVESVEIVNAAVENAKALAAKNGVQDKIVFRSGDCLAELKRVSVTPKTVFFVDPPRAGLSSETARAIAALNPSKILYLSCNLKTLIADLQILADTYQIDSVTPYDMFPASSHIECLVCLTKKSLI